jgi:acyl carrier protein
MAVRDAVEEVFVDILELKPPVDWGSVRYQGVKRWDSLGHMAIIGELEERFAIMFEADDIIDMSDFDRCLAILAKYGVS